MRGTDTSDPAADDLLILVDAGDNVVGHESKTACHDGDGKLHRAFSIFVFNGRGEVLLQQRSSRKRLWPGYWSNSCCSHPRKGEGVSEAASRRLHEELGLEIPLRHLYAFEYRVRFGNEGSEHELCSVFIGRSDAEVRTDPSEIAAIRWISPVDLDAEIEAAPKRLTPWFKMEWQRLGKEFSDEIAALGP